MSVEHAAVFQLQDADRHKSLAWLASSTVTMPAEACRCRCSASASSSVPGFQRQRRVIFAGFKALIGNGAFAELPRRIAVRVVAMGNAQDPVGALDVEIMLAVIGMLAAILP
jgi:hypothetical protein